MDDFSLDARVDGTAGWNNYLSGGWQAAAVVGRPVPPPRTTGGPPCITEIGSCDVTSCSCTSLAH
ncbi:hypothetical protein [Fodinicola acaciae]|uniref:hypothetical protein n=1 Tax=Fodinicola acaciae TaxID=2681555 RepID=UPI0013D881D6|nr:hypothetical protein [Fodinicola acaciae]